MAEPLTTDEEAEVRRRAEAHVLVVGPDAWAGYYLRLQATLDAVKAGYQASFDLRWAADMRAIKRWQAAHPGTGHIWPDHADMVVWLLAQIEARSDGGDPEMEPENIYRSDTTSWVAFEQGVIAQRLLMGMTAAPRPADLRKVAPSE
jgi:hypothetical protein